MWPALTAQMYSHQFSAISTALAQSSRMSRGCAASGRHQAAPRRSVSQAATSTKHHASRCAMICSAGTSASAFQ